MFSVAMAFIVGCNIARKIVVYGLQYYVAYFFLDEKVVVIGKIIRYRIGITWESFQQGIVKGQQKQARVGAASGQEPLANVTKGRPRPESKPQQLRGVAT